MLTKMFKMMKKGNKGFTMAELMVVVVIIGVLTAIAVPVYNNVTAKANRNAVAANLRIIDGAISQYKIDTGNEPEKINDLVPNYIQALPTNPKGATYSVVTGSTDEGTTLTQASVEIDGVNGLANGEYTLKDILEDEDLEDEDEDEDEDI